MSEVVNDSTHSEETTNNKESCVPTAEQVANIREYLIKVVTEEYQKFISVLKHLPLPQQCLLEAYRFLDTGCLWLREAIQFSPFLKKEEEKVDDSTSSTEVTTN